MGERTGKPRGRPPGVRNKRTEALEAKRIEASQTLQEMIPDGFEGDAHTFLVAVYKNPAIDLDTRIDAAKAAIRFEKPALSNIDGKLDATIRSHEDALADLDG